MENQNSKKFTIYESVISNKLIISIIFISAFVFAFLNLFEFAIMETFISNFQSGEELDFWAFLLLISIIYILNAFLPIFTLFVTNLLSINLRETLNGCIIDKVKKISIEEMEKTKTGEIIQRVTDKPENRISSAITSLITIICGSFGAISIFIITLRAGALFVFGILFILMLMLFFLKRVGEKKQDVFVSRQELTRRIDYLTSIVYSRKLASEKKLFAFTPFINDKYEEETVLVSKKMEKSIGAVNFARWLYDNITYIFAASAYALLLPSLQAGKITLGLYIALIPALTRIGKFFVSIVESEGPNLKNYKLLLADSKVFFGLEEQYYSIENNPLDCSFTFKEVHFHNVSFSYPCSDKPIIENLSVKFEFGKKYALVGLNGSGKTTMMKLLLGIYQPQKGEIRIDGKDISKFEFGELQKYFSVLFQDFNRYEYSIKENIFLSNYVDKENDSLIQSAAKQANLHDDIINLSDKYDTIIGKLKDGGIDFSGGQWQKLSTARTFFRQAPIYILDEPTASLDPIAESQLYTSYMTKLNKDSTSIFITHRLGATTAADIICVLDNGKIVEEGTHAELMKLNGLYYKMYDNQRELYL